jgi:ABC-type branched-subunit amino acid transport system substrate-binding protein
MKKILACLVMFSGILAHQARAQAVGRQHHVAIFVPLYLDSAFDETSNYRYGKTFPRQSMTGLEFFEGAQFAMDSLKLEGITPVYHVFDTRSHTGAINHVANSEVMDSIDLIIGGVSGNEYLQLAELAKRRHIPFISATYPNDGGVKNNPQVVIVNAKINTHLQNIYNHVLRSYAGNKIIYLRRSNPADDRVWEVFRSLDSSKTGGVIKLHPQTVPDGFTTADLESKMDSLRQNVILCGSLDEKFGLDVVNACAGLNKAYQTTLVGMPTWESIKEIGRPELKLMPIIYTSSFYNPGTDKWTFDFDANYRKQSFSKPSDIAYKGFEITYAFVHLLYKHDSLLTSNLTDKSFKLLSEYDFRPIRWTQGSPEPDYYENKRVYVLRRLNGAITPLN